MPTGMNRRERWVVWPVLRLMYRWKGLGDKTPAELRIEAALWRFAGRREMARLLRVTWPRSIHDCEPVAVDELPPAFTDHPVRSDG